MMGGRGGTVGRALAAGTVSVRGEESPLKFASRSQSPQPWRRITTHTIDASTEGLAGGEKFGGIEFRMNHDTGVAKVVYINSAEALKGQGVGNRLYAAAMIKAKSLGAKEFTSDLRVSKSAYKSWQSLQRKLGSAVQEVAGKRDAGNQYESDQPIFRVRLSRVSSGRLGRIQRGK